MDVPEHLSALDPGLVAAYRATHYRVDLAPPFTMKVDVHGPGLGRLMQAGGHTGAMFITAWNPLGESLSRDRNEQRQQRLIDELRAAGLAWVPGVGSDPSGAWPDEEVSVLVPDVDRAAACDWGRRHGQNAVLWADTDAVPKLLLLR
ncbi:uncharacterized protein DUF3293 [Panacagrimonas perspica]|uniref:Uncharacterized protein DUF3293 n=1 Tax=Panacagrimonas perspica TaxID=381431 RepID=A0A4R7NX96_9GAMM|nr:DUF3293 domain-containing protein [Panacagrimonas perspica]TDU25728.1 uncharacterized protein DUF3293 [Panacagrimonas perspica]THD02884.1 hypothetical protein B1810_13340 [Panacagrimonas perspica]